MPQQNYLDELTPAFTPLLAIKEASRCLLCHDAPCSQACPAQTDPGKFIRSIYFRNFKGAAETIRENNALGAVCARVCPTEKLCQSGCTRAGVDAPIDIGRLQRFVTDFEQQTGMEIYQPGTKTLGKVAIIGAGPAGLQASVTLTNQGYDVTIYEKEAHPGGWLRNGIPQFRLPQSVLDAEIARIEKMGVTIKCNNEVGNTLTLEQLKAEKQALKEAEKTYMELHTAYENDRSVLQNCAVYLEKGKKLESEDQVIKSLSKTANGRLSGSAKIDFETYIQRQYFKQIIHEANKRLLTMSNHQFILKLKEEANTGRKTNEGLDLSVYSLVTDSERDVKTLSGGESFLAALAMALGLSDIVERSAGAIHPDMMFIDEGFGSLDAQSRQQAIEVLAELAGDSRMVGIISHVTELKEQIDRKLVVNRTDNGSRAVWAE